MRKLFSIIAATLFATTMFAAVQEFSMTISTSDFNKTSYAANNNEKTTTAVSTSDPSVTMDVKWTSNQMMLKSDGSAVQGQKNAGLIYNAASWGKVKSVTINDNSGFAYIIGSSEKPSTSAEGGFFQIKAGSSTSTCTSIVIVFEADPAQASLIAADYDLGEVLCEPEGIFAEDITVKVEGANLTDEISFTTMSEKLSFVTTGNLPATGGNLVIRVTAAAGTELNEDVVLTSGTMIKSFTVKGKVFEKYYTPGTTRVSFDAGDKAQGGDTTFVNGQKAVKVGTSSAAGTALIHVPAGATKLYFLAAAWANKPCKLTLSADGITMDPSANIQLTADAGISGNSPFYTQKGDLKAYEVVVTLSGVTAATDITVTATTSDKRFVLWDVTADVTAPEPQIIAMTYTTDDLAWIDATASQGWWQIYGGDDDYYFTLSNGNEVDEPAGTYSVADLDATASYISLPTGGKLTFTAGQLVVAVSADDVVTIKGDLTATDANIYRFDLTYDPAQENPYKFDQDVDFSATFSSYTIDDEDFEDYGVIYVEGEEDGKYIVIEFFLPESITTPSAVAGIYPVNTSTDDQTVMSGSYDGEVYPSFAGTLDDEGYVEKIWYLVTGNVTVADNFDITVAAKNSKDHNIAVTLKATSTSIKNAEVMQKVVKAIENGQLIIYVNGVRYNVNGAIVK